MCARKKKNEGTFYPLNKETMGRLFKEECQDFCTKHYACYLEFTSRLVHRQNPTDPYFSNFRTTLHEAAINEGAIIWQRT